MGRCNRRAVVAGEHDERVVAQLEFIERLHETAKSVVHLRDAAMMGAIGGRVRWIQLRVFVVGGYRFMRLVKADVEEKWLGHVATRFQPVDGFISHNVSRISFYRTDRLTVANE